MLRSAKVVRMLSGAVTGEGLAGQAADTDARPRARSHPAPLTSLSGSAAISAFCS